MFGGRISALHVNANWSLSKSGIQKSERESVGIVTRKRVPGRKEEPGWTDNHPYLPNPSGTILVEEWPR